MMSADTWCGFCTYDGPALAAEVARLTAELIQTRTDTLRVLDEMRAHHKAEIALVQGFAREEHAALRAQLAAGEGWNENDWPESGQRVQIIVEAEYYHASPAYSGYAVLMEEGHYIYLKHEVKGWRPAPPQE